MNLIERTNHFIHSANIKFESKFDYSMINYTNAITKVQIYCPVHGKFNQTPATHLTTSYGCPYCGTDAMARLQKQKTYEKFIAFSNKKENVYDYSMCTFNLITDKITVICKDHGPFSLTLDHHLHGVGCRVCANQRRLGGYTHKFFNNNKHIASQPGIFYVIRMFSETESFIKIGITKHSVETRYKYSPYKYEIIKTVYDSIYSCFKLEEQLKITFKNSKYINSKNFHKTESFNIFILNDLLSYL